MADVDPERNARMKLEQCRKKILQEKPSSEIEDCVDRILNPSESKDCRKIRYYGKVGSWRNTLRSFGFVHSVQIFMHRTTHGNSMGFVAKTCPRDRGIRALWHFMLAYSWDVPTGLHVACFHDLRNSWHDKGNAWYISPQNTTKLNVIVDFVSSFVVTSFASPYLNINQNLLNNS